MITTLIMWVFDIQIPNWIIPVAGIIGIGAVIYSAFAGNK